MCIGCVPTWIWFGPMRIECALNQSRWIGTESEPNSLFIHQNNNKITHSYTPQTAASSKLLLLGHHTCCICCLRYELWWPIMLGHYWLDATKKRLLISCSLLKFTFHVIYYQRQGMANNWMDFSVCSDTSRMLAQYREGINRYLGCSECDTPTAIQL